MKIVLVYRNATQDLWEPAEVFIDFNFVGKDHIEMAHLERLDPEDAVDADVVINDSPYSILSYISNSAPFDDCVKQVNTNAATEALKHVRAVMQRQHYQELQNQHRNLCDEQQKIQEKLSKIREKMKFFPDEKE